jgi:hypothetical protein
VTDIERAVRAQLVTIVQSTQTEFRAFGRVVRVRQQGRLHQVLGVYRTTEHGSYHQAREDAIARLARAEAQARHMAETSCDGLLPGVP